MKEKEKFSQPEAVRRHPRLERVSRTRKVLHVNFRGNRAEVDFCARYNAESLSEAVQRPDAAIDFLSNIEDFVARDLTYLSEPIMIAIGTGGSRTSFFVGNLGCFAMVMEGNALKQAFCFAVGVDEIAARYFIRNKREFENLPYLGRATLAKAMKIAQKKVNA